MAGRRAHVLSVPPVLTNLRASGSERPGDSQDHHLLPLAQLIQLHGSARRVLKQRNRRNASGRGGCIQSHHQDTGLDQFKDRSLAPPPDECKTTAARLGHKRVTGHAVDRSAHRKCCSAVTRHRYSQEAIRRANVDSIRRTAQAAIGRYTCVGSRWGGSRIAAHPIGASTRCQLHAKHWESWCLPVPKLCDQRFTNRALYCWTQRRASCTSVNTRCALMHAADIDWSSLSEQTLKEWRLRSTHSRRRQSWRQHWTH